MTTPSEKFVDFLIVGVLMTLLIVGFIYLTWAQTWIWLPGPKFAIYKLVLQTLTVVSVLFLSSFGFEHIGRVITYSFERVILAFKSVGETLSNRKTKRKY